MWKAVISLGLAAVAMALPVEKSVTEQTIRIGAVGLSFASFKGDFVSKTPPTDGSFPTYVFKSNMDGAPVEESDFINFRCNPVTDFFVAPKKDNTPVLFCRSIAFEQVEAPVAEKAYFLFSARGMPIPSGIDEVHLSFGRNVWKTVVSSFPGVDYTTARGVYFRALDVNRGTKTVFTGYSPFFDDLTIE